MGIGSPTNRCNRARFEGPLGPSDPTEGMPSAASSREALPVDSKAEPGRPVGVLGRTVAGPGEDPVDDPAQHQVVDRPVRQLIRVAEPVPVLVHDLLEPLQAEFG